MLELWHPTGAPEHRLGFGGAAHTASGSDVASGVDFALVAPIRAELSPLWLEQAVLGAAARLRGGGQLCVVVPRHSRHAAGRLIRRAGLATAGVLLTVPPWPECAHALSLDTATVRDAGARHLRLHPTVAGCLAALVRSAMLRAAVARAAPGCALLAARQPGSEPLRWLSELDGCCGPCAATMTISRRADEQVAVVLRFSRAHRAPDLVAKVALAPGGRERVERERSALIALGDGARRAGAAVPVVVAAPRAGLLAMTALAGRPAGALIAFSPDRAAAILTAVSAWLRDWIAVTAFSCTAEPGRLRRLLIAPAERLAATAGGSTMTRYAEALRLLAARLEGRTLVLAAAHNDLTMSNVLVGGARIGIVDWESASAAAPPLVDLWYASSDAVARAARITHAQAVAALARCDAPLPAALAAAPDARARDLGLSADEALLSFHACWLHHAVNELDRGEGDGPFTAVVRAVAATRLRWPGDAEGSHG